MSKTVPTSKKLVLDDIMLKSLAGLLPCNNDFTLTVTLDVHKELPVEYQPKFTVSPYSNKELKDVINNSQILKDEALDDFANESIRKHIKNISNLINISTGEIIPFTTESDGTCSKEVYTSLPMIVKSGLMSIISQISSGISS